MPIYEYEPDSGKCDTCNGLFEVMQAMGAEGFKTDHPIARHFAGAKMAMYLDGATEIQNVVIARSLFAEPK